MNTDPASSADPRAEQARAWALAALNLTGADFAVASADAGFRRYFRLRHQGRNWIVMDAPPQLEDCRPFLRVGALMREAGLHVPEVLAQDLAAGFLLLSDLGTQTYLELFKAEGTGRADELFAAAIEALVAWQQASRPYTLPEYDEALLRRELKLFPDWYLSRQLGRGPDAGEQAVLDGVFDALVAAALAQPRVYVHRDYMPRNLMLSTPNPGVLDFQDAVYGPLAYDPICLFKDAFWSWPSEDVERWLRLYHQRALAAGLPAPDWAAFRRDCDWIGLHRHLKVLGIFARLKHRDSKPKYVADAPRFLGYVAEVAPRYPELAPLAGLLARRGQMP